MHSFQSKKLMGLLTRTNRIFDHKNLVTLVTKVERRLQNANMSFLTYENDLASARFFYSGVKSLGRTAGKAGFFIFTGVCR